MKITTFLSVNKGKLGMSNDTYICIVYKGSKLPLNKGFKNLFEVLQSCAQPSTCASDA